MVERSRVNHGFRRQPGRNGGFRRERTHRGTARAQFRQVFFVNAEARQQFRGVTFGALVGQQERSGAGIINPVTAGQAVLQIIVIL